MPDACQRDAVTDADGFGKRNQLTLAASFAGGIVSETSGQPLSEQAMTR
jgi:hypothetical protein